MNNISELEIIDNIDDTVNFINKIFDEAIIQNISDIHIEPTANYILIRFRQDGDFLLNSKIWLNQSSSIVTRIKVLWKVKIDESKKPQDWKISYESEKLKMTVDIRMSTLPTSYWEKIVLRILKQDWSLINLEKVWFLDLNLEKVKEALKSKYGIILVAWPTWSGKSTTLFSVLKNFDPLSYNISTLEDPIEYNMEFVNQSQIRPEIWYTFASGLRSLVRQDPDIIMVWEIRDKETALLSIEAALTWHLVLSTIHTNSAAATIQRLINMGIEPFLIASALKMIISQRLVKKICNHCKWVHNVENSLKIKIKENLKDIMDEEEIDNLEFYKWAWCEKCKNSWYSWRMWVHEVLVLGEYLEKEILSLSSVSELHKKSCDNWMITILQDWLIKARMWETTLEEVFKLI